MIYCHNLDAYRATTGACLSDEATHFIMPKEHYLFNVPTTYWYVILLFITQAVNIIVMRS